MSHVASVELCVTDLDALEQAADEVGLELVRGQTTYKWYGRFMNDWRNDQRAASMKGHDPSTFGRCEHALRQKGKRAGEAYEVGLVARDDGQGWDLMYDSWGSGSDRGEQLERLAGKDLTGLKCGYAAAVSERQLVMGGYRTMRRTNDQGDLQVVGVKA